MSSRERLLPLDALRGLAAFFVAFSWHYRHLVEDAPPPLLGHLHWFYAYGYNLVDFFFVLSGFVFCHVYQASILNRRVDFREYAILRLSRLYPLHLLTLFLVAGLQWYRMARYAEPILFPADFYHFLLNLVYLHAGWFESYESFNGPSWSICCEIIAYIAFFGVLAWSRTRGKRLPLYGAMVLIGITAIRLSPELPLFNYLMGRAILGFFMGCLTFEASAMLRRHQRANQTTLILLSIALTGVIVMANRIGMKPFLGEWALVMTLFIYPATILLSLHLSLLYRILSFKPFTYLGEISYSVYLIHVPAHMILLTLVDFTNLRVDMTSAFQYGLFILVVLGLSAASYEFFEKPLSRMARRRYSAWKTAQQARTSAQAE
ncbi:MAG: acyltransferase [Kiritimatiellae bacterium]|nr:acyltransferase [Kiritimatiellia bacterium]